MYLLYTVKSGSICTYAELATCKSNFGNFLWNFQVELPHLKDHTNHISFSELLKNISLIPPPPSPTSIFPATPKDSNFSK